MNEDKALWCPFVILFFCGGWVACAMNVYLIYALPFVAVSFIQAMLIFSTPIQTWRVLLGDELFSVLDQINITNTELRKRLGA